MLHKQHALQEDIVQEEARYIMEILGEEPHDQQIMHHLQQVQQQKDNAI